MLKFDNVYYSATENGAEKKIINGVSFEINESFVALTGPNGGGKSTIARLIMGIIKPTSGRIYFDGVDITDMSVTERARAGISFAFQQPVRFKGITVSDLISVAAGKPLKMTEVCDYLSEVGLCAREYVDREINGSLSGGELKRIEIASVMARGGKLTVFDEPEAGIDLWSFNSLIKVFENLRSKNGGSALIISHQERILEFADRIILVKGGKIDMDGRKDKILDGIMTSVGCHTLEKKMRGNE